MSRDVLGRQNTRQAGELCTTPSCAPWSIPEQPGDPRPGGTLHQQSHQCGVAELYWDNQCHPSATPCSRVSPQGAQSCAVRVSQPSPARQGASAGAQRHPSSAAASDDRCVSCNIATEVSFPFEAGMVFLHVIAQANIILLTGLLN